MYDVITIGTATRDVYIAGEQFKVLRDPKHLEQLGFTSGEVECFALGTKMDIRRPVLTVGGGAINAAVTFSRCGYRTGAYFKVGDDELGGAIKREIKEEGITSFVSEVKQEGTGYSTILLNENGERTVLAYRGASNTITKKDIVFNKLNAKWVYIVSGHLPIALLTSLVTHLKKQGSHVVFAPSHHHAKMGCRKLKPVLKCVDVVLLNREEAAMLTGEKYEKEKSIFKVFDDVVEGIAVMTEGPNGCLASDGRYMYRSGTFPEKKLVDRTGAGDAFGAGFVAGLMDSPDIPHALRFASANATSVVEHVGASAGALTKKGFTSRRWKYLDLDIEPL